MHPSHAATRRAAARATLGLLLALGGVSFAAPPAAAAPLSAELEAVGRVGVGYDSNVFREASSVQRGWLLPYDLRLSYELLPSSSSRVRLALHGGGNRYAAPREDGAMGTYGADLRYDVRLTGGNRRHIRPSSLDLQVRGFFKQRDRTYFSRVAGEEFSVVSAGDTVFLGDRYDSRARGGVAVLSLRWPRSTQWSAEYCAMRRDYVEDYEDLPDVDRLDYDNSRWHLRVRQRLAPWLRLEVRYARSYTDYAEWSARDRDGDRVPDVAQAFRYATTTVSLKTKGLGWGQIGLGVARKARSDPFQGYYDYTQRGLNFMARVTLIPRLELTFTYDYFHREYARAHVSFNPSRPLREDFDRIVGVEAVRHVTGNCALLARVVYEDTDESNPAYAFKRLRGWIGYQFRY